MRIQICLWCIAILLATSAAITALAKSIDPAKGEFAVSIGTNAYLFEPTLPFKLPKASILSELPSVLVPPRTLLWRFTGKTWRHPGSGTKHFLALTEFGEWIFVPSVPGAVINQSQLFDKLLDEPEEPEVWLAFSTNTITQFDKIVVTRGEVWKGVFSNDNGTTAVIFESHLPGFDKKKDALSYELGSGKSRYKVRILDQERGKYFRLPTQKVRSVLEDHDIKESDDHRLNDHGLEAIESVNIFRSWPQIYKIGTVLQYGCQSTKATRQKQYVEKIGKKLSSKFSLPFGGPSIEFGGSIEIWTESTAALHEEIEGGLSQSDQAHILLSGGEKMLIFGQAAECDGQIKRNVVWHRLNTQDSAPYLFGKSDFRHVEKSTVGVQWDKRSGRLSIDCFFGTYEKLLQDLTEAKERENLVRIFLLRHLRPSGTGNQRWRDVFACTPVPANVPVPATRD